MREGEWLPASVASNTPANLHGGWIGFLPLPLISFGFVALAIAQGIGGDLSALFAATLGLGGLAVSGFIFFRERRFRELAIRPGEAAMLYEIDVADAVLVSVRIVQGCAVTGHDRGAMWIEEGRLLFSGPRMSFALPRGQVGGAKLAQDSGDFELQLLRSTPVGPLALSIAPLVGDRPFATPIDRTVARWLDAAPVSTEEGQWPPSGLGPGALNANRLRGRWIAKRCGWAFAVGFLGFPFAEVLGLPLPFVGLLIVGLLASLVVPCLAQTQPIRDRKALEGS